MKKLKTLSRSTKDLLQAGEGQDLDYKEKPNGLKSEDLVAFANGGGGTLLLGVREVSGVDGAQAGRPVGCKVDDHTLLAIQNKASECQPPISLHIQIENTNSFPIIRIDIPDSRFKPHGTSSGLYKIRSGSANRGLGQHELLNMFLTREGDAFISRFKSAISDTEQTLHGIEDMVFGMSSELGAEIDQLKDSMIGAMQQIEESARDHDESNNELSDKLDSIDREHVSMEQHIEAVPEIARNSRVMKDAIEAVLNHFGITDPDKKGKLIHIENLGFVVGMSGKEDREQFKNSMADLYQYLTEEEIEEATAKGFDKGVAFLHETKAEVESDRREREGKRNNRKG